MNDRTAFDRGPLLEWKVQLAAGRVWWETDMLPRGLENRIWLESSGQFKTSDGNRFWSIAAAEVYLLSKGKKGDE